MKLAFIISSDQFTDNHFLQFTFSFLFWWLCSKMSCVFSKIVEVIDWKTVPKRQIKIRKCVLASECVSVWRCACLKMCVRAGARAYAYSRAYERTRVRFEQTVKVTIVIFPSWCFRSQSFNRWRCNEKSKETLLWNFVLYTSCFLLKIKILFCFVSPHSSFRIVS